MLSVLGQAANRLTEEKRAVLEDVSFTYSTDTRRVGEAKQELEAIAQAVSMKGFGRVVCKNGILPGTTVTIGRASLVITNALQNVALYYQDGDICIGTAR